MVAISMVTQGVPMLMEYTVHEDAAQSRQSLRDKRVSHHLRMDTIRYPLGASTTFIA